MDSICDIVSEHDLLIKDIGDAVDIAIANNPKAVLDYRNGNHKAINAIIGAVMHDTSGTVEPHKVLDLVRERLDVKTS